MSKTWGLISFILFCIGLILAVVGGLVFPENAIIGILLAVFGLIIGIIYVAFVKDNQEINTLLLSTIALLAMTAAFAHVTFLGVGKMAASILVYFAALMSPVALLAAIKALLHVGFGSRVKI
ncbi:MAG: hypothetical protein NT082_01000 [Chloroflexi bacterium]|nr:hypothetical protein [Chloroflexota bacterium]